LTGIKFVFSDGKNSESFEKKISFPELETVTFEFTIEELNISEIESVSVSPFYTSGSQKEILGGVTSDYDIQQGIVIECTPNPDPCAGLACGTATDGCGGMPISCGSPCGEGLICSEGVCVSGECTPDPDPCGAMVCGTVDDGCGELISCGTPCDPGYECIAGLSCEEICIPSTPCDGRSCGTDDDGCGGMPMDCGTCGSGFVCSEEPGLCIPEVSVNSGVVDLTWPPGINLIIDSYNLSTTETYLDKFAKFPGSVETRCLPIEDYVLPTEPEYTKGFFILDTPGDGKTDVSSGDNYEIWNSSTCGT
jgi:hypothetical protein